MTGTVPDDLFSHRDAWRRGLALLRDTANYNPPDVDDKSYWQHELDVFDRVFAALTASASEPANAKDKRIQALEAPINALHGPLSVATLEDRASEALCALEAAVEALTYSRPLMHHYPEARARHETALKQGKGVIERLRSANPAPTPDARETCQRCRGNGEIVTDWERYRHPHEGDAGDAAVAECPDCDGIGSVSVPTPDGAVTTEERVAAAWNSIADEHSGWSALSLDERSDFIRFAAALSHPKGGAK